MARVGDAPYPIVSKNLHPECPTQGLHVAIDFFIADTDPDVALWDRATWDDPNPASGWVTGTKWVEITGDIQSLVIDRPEQSDLGLPGTAALTMQLSNALGNYTQINQLGRLHDLAIGGLIAVWFIDPVTNEDGWQFFGRVATWEEDYGVGPNAKNRDIQNIVSVTAYDSSFLLNQAITGLSYIIGNEGETAPERIAYLAALVGFTRGLKLDSGIVRHRAIESSNPILETMQVTAESDGGIVFIDHDGQIMFLNRNTMMQGRADQPKPIPIFSDQCSEGTLIFWEGDPITDDVRIRNNIVLTNIDTFNINIVDQESMERFGRRVLAYDEQTWTTVDEGTTLANYLLNRLHDAFFRVAEVELYNNGWPLLRIGDMVRYQRTLTDGTRVDTNLILSGCSWEYGPSSALSKFSTFRIASVNVFTRWDDANALWDQAVWTH